MGSRGSGEEAGRVRLAGGCRTKRPALRRGRSRRERRRSSVRPRAGEAVRRRSGTRRRRARGAAVQGPRELRRRRRRMVLRPRASRRRADRPARRRSAPRCRRAVGERQVVRGPRRPCPCAEGRGPPEQRQVDRRADAARRASVAGARPCAVVDVARADPQAPRGRGPPVACDARSAWTGRAARAGDRPVRRGVHALHRRGRARSLPGGDRRGSESTRVPRRSSFSLSAPTSTAVVRRVLPSPSCSVRTTCSSVP